MSKAMWRMAAVALSVLAAQGCFTYLGVAAAAAVAAHEVVNIADGNEDAECKEAE